MLFINWRSVGFIALALALAIAPVIFMRLVSRRVPQLWARILAAIIGTPLFLFGLGLTIFFVFVSLTSRNEYTRSIPSPDSSRVARIETWAGFFSTDGGADVKIYSLHGLRSGFAYSGSEYSLYTGGVRWINDHTLEVRYDDSDNAESHTCNDTQNVRVICLPADTPSP